MAVKRPNFYVSLAEKGPDGRAVPIIAVQDVAIVRAIAGLIAAKLRTGEDDVPRKDAGDGR